MYTSSILDNIFRKHLQYISYHVQKLHQKSHVFDNKYPQGYSAIYKIVTFVENKKKHIFSKNTRRIQCEICRHG